MHSLENTYSNTLLYVSFVESTTSNKAQSFWTIPNAWGFHFWISDRRKYEQEMQLKCTEYTIYVPHFKKDDLTTTSVLTSEYNVKSFIQKRLKRRRIGVFSSFYFEKRQTNDFVAFLFSILQFRLKWHRQIVKWTTLFFLFG